MTAVEWALALKTKEERVSFIIKQLLADVEHMPPTPETIEKIKEKLNEALSIKASLE